MAPYSFYELEGLFCGRGHLRGCWRGCAVSSDAGNKGEFILVPLFWMESRWYKTDDGPILTMSGSSSLSFVS
jgi:hypothetical protein